MISVLRAKHHFDHRDLRLTEWDSRSKGMLGQTLEGRVPETTLKIEDESPIPDFFYSGGLPVVSQRMRATLLLLRAQVEFFEVRIQTAQQSSVEQSHWFLNVLKVIDGVDEEKSIIRRSSSGVVTRINKLALTAEAQVEEPIFLLRRYEWIVCVSEALRTAMQTANLTNIRFTGYAEYEL